MHKRTNMISRPTSEHYPSPRLGILTMQFFLTLLLSCVVTAHASPLATSTEPTSYDGITVLRVPLHDSAEVARMKTLVSDMQLSTWSDIFAVNGHADILVPTAKTEAFRTSFSNYTVVHDDLGEAIREESKGFLQDGKKAKVAAASLADLTWFNAYHSYADHVTFVTELQAKFPSNSEIITAGSSVQGNTITGIHIYGSSGKGKNPAIVFHGNVHAREWISSTTVEYITYQLLNNYANSTDVKKLVDTYDFYIFPVVNPDGFSFSQTTTRLWRKNRTPPPSGSSCYGVDINRNWPIQWSTSGGASTNPCDEDYKGTSAGSTPEIKGLTAFSQKLINSTGIELFIDFHSYGQLFLYPTGYSCAVNADSAHYKSLGSTFNTALRAVRGTSYTVEQSCTLYITTGASDDWHYGVLGVHDAFTIELPSTSSFVLPATSILPVGQETWAGVLALLKVV